MLLPLILAAAATTCPTIVRHTAPPGPTPAIILQGVTVPAGAETLYLSGMLAAPIDPAKPATTMGAFGDTNTQALSVFGKMKTLLGAKGYAMGDVVKLTVFIAGDPMLGGKMDFKGFNEAYKMYFGTPDQPNIVARSTVQVAALAAPMYLIEIEATAVKVKCGK